MDLDGLTAVVSVNRLLKAYASGVFPMAESRESAEIFWMDPALRGVLPLDGFRISRSLAKAMRQMSYVSRLNSDFEQVIDCCARREETWINAQIKQMYIELFEAGHAHSFEIWEGNETLAGGVYGVTLGGAFFGESMFSNRTNGSKIALAHLTDHLRRCGFCLFDTQFLTPHLASLGAIEMPRRDYHRALRHAIRRQASLYDQPVCQNPQDVVQRNTQTS